MQKRNSKKLETKGGPNGKIESFPIFFVLVNTFAVKWM